MRGVRNFSEVIRSLVFVVVFVVVVFAVVVSCCGHGRFSLKTLKDPLLSL